MKLKVVFLTALFIAGTPLTAQAGQIQHWKDFAKGAKLQKDAPSVHRKITVKKEKAQRYFNQGLSSYLDFNYDQAVKSFAMGAKVDRSCALCFWGASLALGPHPESPFQEQNAQWAWEFSQMAIQSSATVTFAELALIEAGTKRIQNIHFPDSAIQSKWNVDYLEAMKTVIKKYPGDVEARILLAEALLILGRREPEITQASRELDTVLRLKPEHPGALKLKNLMNQKVGK